MNTRIFEKLQKKKNNPSDHVSYTHSKGAFGRVAQDMFGILLGQSLPQPVPNSNFLRSLVIGWVVSTFIVGTVYRGNLTAALTLPKYPPRPETFQQLVNYVDRQV